MARFNTVPASVFDGSTVNTSGRTSPGAAAAGSVSVVRSTQALKSCRELLHAFQKQQIKI